MPKEFPVDLRREFPGKRLSLRNKFPADCLFEGSNAKIPCIFPDKQGIGRQSDKICSAAVGTSPEQRDPTNANCANYLADFKSSMFRAWVTPG
jgi:hypothetical protein